MIFTCLVTKQKYMQCENNKHRNTMWKGKRKPSNNIGLLWKDENVNRSKCLLVLIIKTEKYSWVVK